ncbi:MAG: Glu/Leu/Phe/Val dehydrogenase [Sphingomonadales bacterium]|nr:Glu/Leu/Phe/Val dehydrogenase [Sphingomonadales bacterium]
MSVFSTEAFRDHEQVVFASDPETGLRAIIAVHSTALGPAVGGCRMWNYASEDDAIRDVLRLSRGMSYKNAMADLGLGGGKSVIIGDSAKDKTPELMRAFGRAVDQLGGRYLSAEDVGISVEDIEIAGTQTKYVAGLNKGEAASGDPSPFTAHGVFFGIKASVMHRLGKADLGGVKVAVQGLGHVGYTLCKELHEAGADLIVTDINTQNINRVVEDFGATAVATDDIVGQDVDVYAPCALGATVNDDSIDSIKAPIIAGAANNVLMEDRHGEILRQRGVLYAPDYVINGGGIINVANEVHGRVVSAEDGMKNVENIYNTLTEIFKVSDKTGRTTNAIADEMAEARIKAGREAKAGKAA